MSVPSYPPEAGNSLDLVSPWVTHQTPSVQLLSTSPPFAIRIMAAHLTTGCRKFRAVWMAPDTPAVLRDRPQRQACAESRHRMREN